MAVINAHRRPPSLNLLTSSSPARPISTSPSTTHRPSQSPFRYLHFPNPSQQDLNEKLVDQTPLSDLSQRAPPITSAGARPGSGAKPSTTTPTTTTTTSSPFLHRTARPHCSHTPAGHPSPLFLRQPTPLAIPCQFRSQPTPYYPYPRAIRLANLLRPWTPIILYAMTTIAFLLAIAFWRKEVFDALDKLSHWLRRDESFGLAVLFSLIFLTTIPPIPLYSTLITLSGYTFGPWTGAILSYLAALSGGLVVFLISRALLRDAISRWLSSAHAIKRVVTAIERRPRLLFLIRLAPYPYNVMNCLLAAAPTLTFRTYTVCTALSLFKVIIHTSLGASIHSFKDYHVANGPIPAHPTGGGGSALSASRVWTAVGIGLCIGIFIYLAIVARRAVDEELGDEREVEGEGEEIVGFLSVESHELEREDGRNGRSMAELPFLSRPLAPTRNGR